jgi:hypothetical protein
MKYKKARDGTTNVDPYTIDGPLPLVHNVIHTNHWLPVM